MLKAKLRKSKSIKNPFQHGDWSFATDIRKQSNGSKSNASIMKANEYYLLSA
tara:strand:- start:245 stop:400 length:156 start_codon:yes stop_codon:yes gene_type:complete